MSDLYSDLRIHASKQLLRYAVSQAIHCPTCGRVLDARAAVLTEGAEQMGIACAPCWESLLERMRERFGADRVGDVLADIKVTDGREIYAAPRGASPEPSAYTARNVRNGRLTCRVEIPSEHLEEVVMGDEHDMCSGPCECTPLEPDGACENGWPALCRVAGAC